MFEQFIEKYHNSKYGSTLEECLQISMKMSKKDQYIYATGVNKHSSDVLHIILKILM